jgi:hypothetical protein
VEWITELSGCEGSHTYNNDGTSLFTDITNALEAGVTDGSFALNIRAAAATNGAMAVDTVAVVSSSTDLYEPSAAPTAVPSAVPSASLLLISQMPTSTSYYIWSRGDSRQRQTRHHTPYTTHPTTHTSHTPYTKHQPPHTP